MGTVTTIRASVEKSYPNDAGRGVARLGPDADGLLPLRMSPGDCVEIEGDDTTVAKVWRADQADGSDIVRLDGSTRQNAGVDIGESVELRKADPENADSLALAPPEAASVQFDSDAVGTIKRQLHNRPVTERDIVPVMWPTNDPFTRSSDRTMPLTVVATEPTAAVLVTHETSVIIRQADM